MTVLKSIAASCISFIALGGACQSTPPPALAVLESADQETLAEVKSTLALALGRASIELGPGDPTQLSAITVLPPRPGPYEQRSLAMPVVFDMMKSGPACLLVRRDTGERFALAPSVKCRRL